jgi:hypothetical protein
MPPRWLSVVIVAFWLGTSAWLLWHDLWPRWRPGEPPPYAIDLIEEVTTTNNKPRIIAWTVLHDDEPVLRAETWVTRPAPDVFELKAEYKPPQGSAGDGASMGPLKVRSMGSTLRVTENGRLLGIEFRVDGQVRVKGRKWFGFAGFQAEGLEGLDFTGQLTWEVQGTRLVGRVHVRDTAGLLDNRLDLAPVQVSAHGSLLVPLHPVNRIQGLRPGRRWRQPVLDPLAGSLAGFNVSPAGAVRFLDAEVRPLAEPRSYKGRLVGCLVIDYRGEEGKEASTWVEEDSGLVVRQEFWTEGGHWEMRREQLAPSSGRRRSAEP